MTMCTTDDACLIYSSSNQHIMKATFHFFSLFALTALILLPALRVDAQNEHPSRLWTFGIGINNLDIEESAEYGPHDSEVWYGWGLAFGRKNYRVDPDASHSFGFFTGTKLEIVFPNNFDFRPDDHNVVFPQFGGDFLQLGLAASFKASEDVSILVNAGGGATAHLLMIHNDYLDANVAQLSYGITPHVGIRALFRDGFSMGLTHRMGSTTGQVYLDGDKVGDSFSYSVSGFFITISL